MCHDERSSQKEETRAEPSDSDLPPTRKEKRASSPFERPESSVPISRAHAMRRWRCAALSSRRRMSRSHPHSGENPDQHLVRGSHKRETAVPYTVQEKATSRSFSFCWTENRPPEKSEARRRSSQRQIKNKQGKEKTTAECRRTVLPLLLLYFHRPPYPLPPCMTEL